MSSLHFSQDENRDCANQSDLFSPAFIRQSVICDHEKQTQENQTKSPEFRQTQRFIPMEFRHSNFNTPINTHYDNRHENVSIFDDLHVSQHNAFFLGPETFTRLEEDSCKNSEKHENSIIGGIFESHGKHNRNMIYESDHKTLEFKKLSKTDSRIISNNLMQPDILKQGCRISIPYKRINIMKFPNRGCHFQPQIKQKEEIEGNGRPMKRGSREKNIKIKRIEKKLPNDRNRIPILKVQKYACSCKKSNCKKEYCICFKNKLSCNFRCSCCECDNSDKKIERQRILRTDVFPISTMITRVGNSYKTISSHPVLTISKADEVKPTSKGCKCKKSNCQKKYCDCFSSNEKCSIHCNCDFCYNK